MKIAICDDIESECDVIAGFVSTYLDDAVLLKYTDANSLVKEHTLQRFDLIFLDMLMPIMGGIETAEKIRAFDEQTPIVFATITEEFAIQSYRVLAFDYLLKPVTEEAIKRCLTRFKKGRPDMRVVTIEYLGISTNILLSNILYFESELRKVNFYLHEGKKITIKAKLDDFHEIMIEQDFCRCHKSYVVNLNYASSILGEAFYLMDGREIKISRSFLREAKKKYFNYVFCQSGRPI